MADLAAHLIRSQLLERRQRAERMRPATSGPDLTSLLQDIDAALERLDLGTYGLCEVCKDPIEADRLLADPLITLCLDHLTRDQQRALEQDLGLAAQIQRSLLPKRPLEYQDWSATYVYEPAALVSGDYCDLMVCRGDADGFCFAAGDVSGKGVAASLLMSNLQATFRSLVLLGVRLRDMMENANRLLCESTLSTHYATLICGHAETTGEVRICNAGHCPPVIASAGGCTVLEGGNLPLGLFCATSYSENTVHLGPGETLVLYTDGVTEACDPAGQEYGLDRLVRAVSDVAHRPANDIVSEISEDLKRFRGSATVTDDMTILAVQRRGGSDRRNLV